MNAEEESFEGSFCFPIIIHCGSRAKIDFNTPSVLHHYTSSKDKYFNYLVKIICSDNVSNSLNKKKLFFLSTHVYNYEGFDNQADIIRDFVFFPEETQASRAASVIPSFFKPHIHHALAFTGEDKYNFSDLNSLTEKWQKEYLNP